MNYKVILFIILFLGVYILGNFYIGTRVLSSISFKYSINSRIFWIIFWVLSLSYLISRFLANYLPSGVTDIFTLVGVYWLAILFYLFLIIPFIDLIRLLNKRFLFLPASMIEKGIINIILALVLAVVLGAILIYGTWNGRNSYVKKYDVTLDKGVHGMTALKVVMVSDIHLGDIIENKRLKKMVQEINSLNPDIVLIAGDIVDSEIQPFTKGKMAREFSNIRSKYGVYASLGNHDIMGNTEEQITKELSEAGVKVLRDSAYIVEDKFYVVGRDDISIERNGKKRKTLDEILDKADKTKPILLIDHTPSKLNEAEDNGVDLQVSGHTHKGQFMPNNLITKMLFEVDYGYLKKANLNVVVSSGYGTWGPPIRLGSRSEIVEINISLMPRR